MMKTKRLIVLSELILIFVKKSFTQKTEEEKT